MFMIQSISWISFHIHDIQLHMSRKHIIADVKEQNNPDCSLPSLSPLVIDSVADLTAQMSTAVQRTASAANTFLVQSDVLKVVQHPKSPQHHDDDIISWTAIVIIFC